MAELGDEAIGLIVRGNTVIFPSTTGMAKIAAYIDTHLADAGENELTERLITAEQHDE